MQIEFELDSQLKAYDILLRNELEPSHISSTLSLKPASSWILELEGGIASLTERWQLICSEGRYRRKYLCSNLKRHIGIIGSVKKTLQRYADMPVAGEAALTVDCRQVHGVMLDGLAGLQQCLEEELEQLSSGSAISGYWTGAELAEATVKTVPDAKDRHEEERYQNSWGKFRLSTRHDLAVIALLWGTMLETGVYVCKHGDKKQIFMFLARHLRPERKQEEMASHDYLLNQSTSKTLDVLNAARQLIEKMLAYIDRIIEQVLRKR